MKDYRIILIYLTYIFPFVEEKIESCSEMNIYGLILIRAIFKLW